MRAGNMAGLPPTVGAEAEMRRGVAEYQSIRAKNARKLFPNAPSKCTCRMCGGKYPNPILEGCQVAFSTCPTCRLGMLSDKTRKRLIRTGEVSARTVERAENNLSQPVEIDPLTFKSLRSFGAVE